jgi:cell division protein FtsL
MMLWARWMPWMAVLLASVVGMLTLSVLKHRTQQLGRDLAVIQRQIDDHQTALQVLDAEWSYLNQPDRLARLASQYLRLQPPQSHQYASYLRALAALPSSRNEAPNMDDVPQVILPQPAQWHPVAEMSLPETIGADE